MHVSVMQWVASVARRIPVKDSRILEVGSYNVNGSVRPIFEALGCKSYLGTDMRPGPGVDMVWDCTYGEVNRVVPSLCYSDASDTEDMYHWPIIVCCEVLEHVQEWRRAIRVLLDHLQPTTSRNCTRRYPFGGHLILTTRSKGFPLHDYPADHWRFELEDMRRIFEGRAVIHELIPDPLPGHPGVFLHAQLPVALEDIDVYKMVP